MLSSAAALHGNPSAKVYACENVEDFKKAWAWGKRGTRPYGLIIKG